MSSLYNETQKLSTLHNRLVERLNAEQEAISQEKALLINVKREIEDTHVTVVSSSCMQQTHVHSRP
jgi:hypothetical protein